MSKNKLEIIEERCELVDNPLYIVQDSNQVYMRTKYKTVAEATFNKLKNEYERTKNAS